MGEQHTPDDDLSDVRDCLDEVWMQALLALVSVGSAALSAFYPWGWAVLP